jgi:error-prone DNA polymerase
MGFYHPATIVKDAQRHGLRVKPIDVTRSDWNCSLEYSENVFALRIGLRYVRGLQQPSAQAVIEARMLAAFTSVKDLARRVPQLSKATLAMLARIGALNNICSLGSMHRRDALWQVERASRKSGPLLEGIKDADENSPLAMMNIEERLVSDFHGTGLTTGPHPMAYRRGELRARGIKSAMELKNIPHGREAMVAGCVITRQRPGTAKGLIFMTLEDETGTSRVIISPDFYDNNRMMVLNERFVLVSGIVQNQDSIVHLKARSISSLPVSRAATPSHDFH